MQWARNTVTSVVRHSADSLGRNFPSRCHPLYHYQPSVTVLITPYINLPSRLLPISCAVARSSLSSEPGKVCVYLPDRHPYGRLAY